MASAFQPMSDYVLHVETGMFFVSGAGAQLILGGELPTLLTQTLITSEGKITDGLLISAATDVWRKILRFVLEDPSKMFEIDPWTWEEIIAASYKESCLFDEVILTPRSND